MPRFRIIDEMDNGTKSAIADRIVHLKSKNREDRLIRRLSDLLIQLRNIYSRVAELEAENNRLRVSVKKAEQAIAKGCSDE